MNTFIYRLLTLCNELDVCLAVNVEEQLNRAFGKEPVVDWLIGCTQDQVGNWGAPCQYFSLMSFSSDLECLATSQNIVLNDVLRTNHIQG